MVELRAVLAWLLVLELCCLAGWPLAFWLFRRVPSLAPFLARPLAMLLSGYFLWVAGLGGFLLVRPTAVLLCLVAVAAVGLALGSRPWRAAQQRRLMLLGEALSAVCFLLWVVVRAYNPEIAGTEKPMEFAFLNAIVRSGQLPPPDPWCAGYSISYYYFGYLIVAALCQLAGSPPALAFNLGVATLFALACSGAFAVAAALAALIRNRSDEAIAAWPYGLAGLVGLALVGNLEGFLEVLHARGLLPAGFWRWLDIKDLLEPPGGASWLPQRYLWWWRASRVVNDRSPLGQPIEVIDEFPFFSFLLGDMHPHVLALPFGILCVALCLEWALRLRKAAPWPAHKGIAEHAPFLALAGLLLGGLLFLNTWDWPVYILLFLGATWIGAEHQRAGRAGLLLAPGLTAAVGLIAYAPFLLSFRSQAAGVLPHFLAGTKLQQFVVMFGPFLLPASLFLLCRYRADGRKGLAATLKLWAGFVVLPYAFLGIAAATALVLPWGRLALQRLQGLEEAQLLLREGSWAAVLARLLLGRLQDPWSIAFMAGFLALAAGLLARPGAAEGEVEERALAADFTTGMLGIAFLLTWVVEFVYLRDYFGTRMNTVFKLYYQAWALLALASPAAVAFLSDVTAFRPRTVALSACAFAAAMGFVYVPLATWTKLEGFGRRPTLDGLQYLEASSPVDHALVRWLNSNVGDTPVTLEASGGSYTFYGRISSNTGLPTVIGWDFHEVQWGRDYTMVRERQEDVRRLYTAASWQEAQALLRRYSVRYVYVGQLERQTYGPRAGELFAAHLPLIWRAGSGDNQGLLYLVP